jgi:hypothetical protein
MASEMFAGSVNIGMFVVGAVFWNMKFKKMQACIL